MFEDDEELRKLQEEQDSARDKKAYLGVAGSVMQNLVGAPSAFEIYTKRELPKPDAKGLFDSLAGAVSDPMEKKRKAHEYLKMKNDRFKQEREMTQAQSADDPTSADSLAMQEQIGGMFPNFKRFIQGKSKTQIQEMMPILTQKIRGDQERENARIAAGARVQEKADAKSEKLAQDQKERTTTYGVARTPDDAKKLKEASELKAKLDNQIGELIAIRKAKGAEVLNRDVVARAKQLSNDLLLTKKNLESLGVLSQSDRDIVDQIIPSDPTQFHFSQLVGQDPTLTKLEAFKKDTDTDFQARLRTRLEDYKEPSRDREAEQYAKMHNISYEDALKVKSARTSGIGRR